MGDIGFAIMETLLALFLLAGAWFLTFVIEARKKSWRVTRARPFTAAEVEAIKTAIAREDARQRTLGQ